jgi:hypothetical protein
MTDCEPLPAAGSQGMTSVCEAILSRLRSSLAGQEDSQASPEGHGDDRIRE